jgi:aspartyl-tRNA(Asn)/glutamyl-tRNA(Gln) amidotransferase subunit B
MGDISGYLNNEKKAIAEIALTPETLAEMIKLIEDNTISTKIGKDILPELLTEGGSAKALIEKKGLIQISDTGAIEAAIDAVIAAHPDELEKYRGGKTKLLGFFVGQVMKQTGGRADPKLTNQLLLQKLNG